MRPFPIFLALSAALALAGCAVATNGDTRGSGPDGLMAWPDLLERPRPEPDTTISYGEDPLQVVDLWLPPGEGPHPVVLMVHGGCWQTEIADRTIMNWIADDLRRRGIAVWNIDYRGVDRGGGYPNTFLDVASAADALRHHSARHRLDLGLPAIPPAATSRSGSPAGTGFLLPRRSAPATRSRSGPSSASAACPTSKKRHGRREAAAEPKSSPGSRAAVSKRRRCSGLRRSERGRC